MDIGFSEDFTSSVVLDAQLKAVPDSGIYLNSGVDPSITVNNLLEHLPKTVFTFSDWDNTKTYGKFLVARDRDNLVTKNSKVYESIRESNTDNDPEEVDSTYWVETNIESLRLKIFLQAVKDRVYSDLGLTRRLVNNQYIYDNGRGVEKTLSGDYSAWVLEPKGSDYVKFRINELCLRKSGTTPVNVYVVNEGSLLETITLAPDEGRNTFRAVNILLSGKGRFYLAIDSTTVISSNATVDPHKFKGFVAYMASGQGDSPEGAEYSYHTESNGLGMNITAYLDPEKFIDNNIVEMAPFIRATFEYMAFQMFLSNPNQRSNTSERGIPEENMLVNELKRFDGDTVVRRYTNEKKRAMKLVDKVYDTELSDKDGKLSVKVGSI